MRIRIALPDDRDFAGVLEVLDASGARILGPVPAAGRAHDETAAAHGNPSRNPLRPYGDTPLGTFAVRGVIRASRAATRHDRGDRGVVLIEPVAGQAALADAHGRFRLFIEGGGDDDGRLRATAGAIRLLDDDQARLAALVQRASGRVSCEVVSTTERGPRISTTEPPLDADPPPVPGRSNVATRIAKSLSRAMSPVPARGVPGFAPRTFVVIPERSGGGGTAYGGDDPGGSPGGGGSTGTVFTGGPNDTEVGALPVTGVDVAPSPGVDLNPPSDDTTVTLAQSGSSDLLSTASPTGISSPYDTTQNGWISGPQPTNPYTNATATDDPQAPFTANPVDSYTGGSSDAGRNAFTGGQSVDPFTNAIAAGPSGGGDATATDASQGTYSAAPQRDTTDDPEGQIQEMVARFKRYDDELAAQQQGTSSAVTDPNASTSTSAQNYSPSSAPNQSFASGPQPDVTITQTYTPAGGVDPSTVSSPPDDPLPWTPAALGSLPGQFTPGVVPSSSTGGQPPPRLESAGAWSRSTPSQAALNGIQQQISMGFLDPSLATSNVATAAASDPNAIPRQIWGQTGEISSYDARLAQGEIGILAPKGVSKAGLDYATATRLPNGDYQINIADTASRYTSNPFKTSPGAALPSWQAELARAFGPNGSFSLPNDPVVEQGVRSAFNAGRVSTVQIDTADFSPLGQGRLTVNGIGVPLDSPTSSQGAPGRGGIGTSALGGAGWGAGFAGVVDVYQILSNPDAHPDPAGELSKTVVLGGASGGTGSAVSTAFEQQFFSSAASAGEVSLFGRVAGGGLGGTIAAPVFTLGQMALSDQSYTAEDYEAKGVRSAAAGAFAGAASAAGGWAAAGIAGAIAGTEVPIVGNIVGFAVGVGAYFLFDALFGDDIENTVRGR